MNDFILIILFLCFICLIIFVIIHAVYRVKKVGKQLEAMERLVEDVISQKPINPTYDESRLGALQVRLKDYLVLISNQKEISLNEKNAIKEVITNISHQVAAPVSNIILYAQLINELSNIPAELSDYTDELKKQAERIDFLFSSIKQLSRLETEVIRANRYIHPVNEIMEQVCDRFFAKAQKRNITITWESSDATCFCDLKWTIEAIGNIIDNAMKYSYDYGIINVECIPYESFVAIRITDYGIGIEESEFNKIFTRFYRSSKVNQYDGIGIGLYLTREIVGAQGGYVMVASKPEKGTTFSVYLQKGCEI